jgi:3-oxoacyl-[acyl-carrier protein] reductase
MIPVTGKGVLDGRVVHVTGASSGIGRAIALRAAGAGAHVAVTYRANDSGAKEVADAIIALGRRAVVLHLDLAEESSSRAVAPAVTSSIGPVDVWINNAGADILTGMAASLPDVDKLDRLLSVDLRGTILASWEAAGALGDRGGVLINMSWDHVLTGMAGRNPQMYGAVKGGVLTFSKCLARSVAPRVRVNVLAPGWIETAFGEELDATTYEAVAMSTPLGRWGTPDDVAAAAVFLASDDARFMTGQTLLVGGGLVM